MITVVFHVGCDNITVTPLLRQNRGCRGRQWGCLQVPVEFLRVSLNTSIIVEGDVTINNPIENNHVQRGIIIKIISNLDIFHLISPSAIVSINQLTMILSIIGQCYVKHMTLRIKTKKVSFETLEILLSLVSQIVLSDSL